MLHQKKSGLFGRSHQMDRASAQRAKHRSTRNLTCGHFTDQLCAQFVGAPCEGSAGIGGAPKRSSLRYARLPRTAETNISSPKMPREITTQIFRLQRCTVHARLDKTGSADRDAGPAFIAA